MSGSYHRSVSGAALSGAKLERCCIFEGAPAPLPLTNYDDRHHTNTRPAICHDWGPVCHWDGFVLSLGSRLWGLGPAFSFRDCYLRLSRQKPTGPEPWSPSVLLPTVLFCPPSTRAKIATIHCSSLKGAPKVIGVTRLFHPPNRTDQRRLTSGGCSQRRSSARCRWIRVRAAKDAQHVRAGSVGCFFCSLPRFFLKATPS